MNKTTVPESCGKISSPQGEKFLNSVPHRGWITEPQREEVVKLSVKTSLCPTIETEKEPCNCN